ncbi:MAG: hypothetical protein NVS1B6_19980 [Steroidobacteraceae bacterium]
MSSHKDELPLHNWGFTRRDEAQTLLEEFQAMFPTSNCVLFQPEFGGGYSSSIEHDGSTYDQFSVKFANGAEINCGQVLNLRARYSPLSPEPMRVILRDILNAGPL